MFTASLFKLSVKTGFVWIPLNLRGLVGDDGGGGDNKIDESLFNFELIVR